jgi:hypothetical protein
MGQVPDQHAVAVVAEFLDHAEDEGDGLGLLLRFGLPGGSQARSASAPPPSCSGPRACPVDLAGQIWLARRHV